MTEQSGNKTAIKKDGKKESRDLRQDAARIANSIQVEGQTREQQRLIATGIQRGMEVYLRQQAERSRELDKRAKKIRQAIKAQSTASDSETNIETDSVSGINVIALLPWGLLLLSWIFFLLFVFVPR